MPQPDWTEEQKLSALMALPWTVIVTAEDDHSLFAEIAEISDAVADGENERELSRELWNSLYASLTLRLERGDPIPLPPGQEIPWENRVPVWHPTLTKAPPLIGNASVYLKALHSQLSAGNYALQ